MCDSNEDCPALDDALDGRCASAVCNEGVCGIDFAASGSKVEDISPGDCHVPTCDGTGLVLSLPDTTDSPTPVVGDCHASTCSEFGQIVNQSDDTDLPTADACQVAACTDGSPGVTNASTGTSCGDFSHICSGNGHCGVCLPGAFQCESTQAQRCSNDGEWSSSDECGALGCNGSCIVPTQVAVGLSHSCALLSDETVRCWGDNSKGQLGLAASVTATSAPTPIPSLSHVKQIASGANHVCARNESGDVFCWGANDLGQIGIGSNATALFLPRLVKTGTNELSVGWDTSCARTPSATYCWGSDSVWGTAPPGTWSSPHMLDHPEFDHSLFALGQHAACKRGTSPSLSCWGSNESYQVDDSDPDHTPSYPQPRMGVPDATRLSVGEYGACAVQPNETVTCWGSFISAGLGNMLVLEHIPTAAVSGIVDATDVSVGTQSACILRTTGEVACFGRNAFGELGVTPAYPSHTTPATVPGLSGVTSLAVAKGRHSCFVTASDVYCTGYNDKGQLGDGTLSNRTAVTKVVW